MYVLGIWDGHDAGAALVSDNEIIYAANEERFTKRKLEADFPYNSIAAALEYAKITPSDIEHVAFTTTEFTKTLERMFPSMKENYYKFRRRKMLKPRFETARHNLKYTMTSVGILPATGSISSYIVKNKLKQIGFKNFKLHVVEHHTAHAATAAFTAPFKDSLVITLDGLGDGLSGSVSTLHKGKLERHQTISARDSLGIFFEQVTNIVGMRELEDEGKVMAMADYSFPFSWEENRFKDFFTVSGTRIQAKYSSVKQFELLQRMAWQMPREQFAYMAQQLMENMMTKFTSNVIDRYGKGDVTFSGGTFANIKANMKIRSLENLKHWYVFPHMGDGGIALGAALYTNYMLNGTISYPPFNSYLGNSFSVEETEEALKKDRALKYEIESDAEHSKHAAELIAKDNYLFWFQGRMEYGPRALGCRSILAASDSENVKEKLNIYVKKREWFQPFAPSLLESEVERMVDFDDKGYDKFMTSAYYLKEDLREKEKSVVHIDGSARTHMVGEENPKYMSLLKHLKHSKGYGIVLNTSFNIHGMPIVMTPEDAIMTMKATKTRYMFINGIFVTNRSGVLMLPNGTLEYIFTIGIIISLVALIIGSIKDRKNIFKTISSHGFEKRDLLIVIAILIVFVFIELYFIKPTQLLFFDDAIYQAMSLDLLHTGQAWMCNYGTPLTCFSGQVYHEPIGLSFNIAIAFLIGGVTRSSAYAAEFCLGLISIFFSFFAALLLLKNKKAAYFTELLMALSPVILVWAFPTNSDLAVLAYSMVSVFFILLFINKKSFWSFSNLLFSFSLLLYMKVDEFFFIPVFIAFYFLLEEKNIRKTIGKGLSYIKGNFLNTKLLILLLFFIFAIAPSILYSFNEYSTDTYGYQGTIIQNTCTANLAPVNVTHSIDLANFKANVCANVGFWFNQYKSQYIMQPIVFTVIAIAGAAIMLIDRKKTLAAMGIWFLVFFFLYTTFYAGSVIYGVDWRFMLSLIAQACIFGGFFLGTMMDEVQRRVAKLKKINGRVVTIVALIAILVILLYPIYSLMPLLAISPSQIQQAGDARFYENFVYNSSNLIPPGCIVYSYDPTLFNINNRTSTQIDNLYNTTQVNLYRSQYQCLVLDYGYWCHTPNNECAYVNNTFNLVPIKTATYNQFGYKYGFYMVEPK